MQQEYDEFPHLEVIRRAFPELSWQDPTIDSDLGAVAELCGDHLVIGQLRDGWAADCDDLGLALRAESLAALLGELRTALEDLLVGISNALGVPGPEAEVTVASVRGGAVRLDVVGPAGRGGAVVLDWQSAEQLGEQLRELSSIARRLAAPRHVQPTEWRDGEP